MKDKNSHYLFACCYDFESHLVQYNYSNWQLRPFKRVNSKIIFSAFQIIYNILISVVPILALSWLSEK